MSAPPEGGIKKTRDGAARISARGRIRSAPSGLTTTRGLRRSSGRHLVHRQGDAKLCAETGVGRHPDFASVMFNDHSRYGETDSHSLRLCREERVEDVS